MPGLKTTKLGLNAFSPHEVYQCELTEAISGCVVCLRGEVRVLFVRLRVRTSDVVFFSVCSISEV